MPEFKVAIFEDDPKKLEQYETALSGAGHRVVARVTSLDGVTAFLDHFSDEAETTPDVVLVDGTIDEDKALEAIARSERAAGLGRDIGNMVLQGAAIVHQILERKTDRYRIEVERSQTSKPKDQVTVSDIAHAKLGADAEPLYRLPEGSLIPSHVKIVGISSVFPLEQADLPHATPQELVDYLASLPAKE